MRRIAIIGAGVGGLTLANALSGHAKVTVFEKGRGVGGRTSSRREGIYRFDHGAPHFTVRTPEFATWIAPLRAAGTVAEWHGPVVNLQSGGVLGSRFRSERYFVGVPGMNAIARYLEVNLDVRVGTEVAPLPPGSAPYALVGVTGEQLGTFDLVVSTAPLHQTRHLFREAGDAGLTDAMKPRHALMVAIDKVWDEEWIAARVMDGPLRWISIDSSKPGRPRDVTALVAHTRSGWSRHHTETPADLLAPILLHALRSALPVDIAEPSLVKAHRWRSALVRRAQRPGPWMNPVGSLGATGDWSASSRIEEVCLSALDLAARIKRAAA